MLNRSNRLMCPARSTSQLGVVVSLADSHSLSGVYATTVVGRDVCLHNNCTVHPAVTLVGPLRLKPAQDGCLYILFRTIVRLLLPAVAAPLPRLSAAAE